MGKLIVDCYMSRKTKKDLFRNWWDHIWFKWQPLQPSSGPDFGRAHRESDATEYSHCKNNAKRSAANLILPLQKKIIEEYYGIP